MPGNEVDPSLLLLWMDPITEAGCLTSQVRVIVSAHKNHTPKRLRCTGIGSLCEIIVVGIENTNLPLTKLRAPQNPTVCFTQDQICMTEGIKR